MAEKLKIRVGRYWYSFTSHADGLVTVKLGHRERSAMAGGLGPFGIAGILIRELLRERDDG